MRIKTFCRRISELKVEELGLPDELLERIKKNYGSVAECQTEVRGHKMDFYSDRWVGYLFPEEIDLIDRVESDNCSEEEILRYDELDSNITIWERAVDDAFSSTRFLRSKQSEIWYDKTYQIVNCLVTRFFHKDRVEEGVAEIWYNYGCLDQKYEEFNGFDIERLFSIFSEGLPPMQCDMTKYYITNQADIEYTGLEEELLRAARHNIANNLKHKIIDEIIL